MNGVGAGLVYEGLPPKQAVDGRSARWAAHREQRRRALIKAARQAVHRLGPDASMEEIATTAGTSKSVFYRYFGDKAGLQQAVGDVAIRQMHQTVLAAAKTAASPRQGLKNMVTAYLQMAETSPHVYAFATQAPGTERQTTDSAVPVAGVAPTTGALSSFFDAVISMAASPLGAGLAHEPHSLDGNGSDPDGALLRYWPTAAIGMVRTAGELWLLSDPEDRPTAEQMAEDITCWLYEGVSSRMTVPVAKTPENTAEPPTPQAGKASVRDKGSS